MAEASTLKEGRPVPPFPIVAIGASAGGVRALQAFFSALPESVGAAFVVVIHLDPEHDSELAEVISAQAPFPVQQVRDAIRIEPDHVYVIPPNRRLYVSDRELRVAAFDEPRGRRAPIDQFFRSVAEQYGDGFAIILSGAGSDGALGVRAVKEAGGIVLVQDPNEAEYSSMPRSAIHSSNPEFVLPVRDMARQLAELVRAKRQIEYQKPEREEEEFLRRILMLLKVRTGNDFSEYKRSSLMRRLARRMQVVRAETLGTYHTYLREHAEEIQALFDDLLISVTSFFRDAVSYERLEKIAIPAIFDKKTNDEGIRVWIPSCATGEEAYSIAMLLLLEAAKRDVRPDIQVFATDLDARALAVAREGCYPSTIGADVSDDRLRKFFNLEGDEYRIKREVRDIVVFAVHNLLKDPPFSRLDLVSCRNFLIYINRDLQQKVISTFYYALLADGYLFLGSAETTEHPDGLFRAIDRGARIYQSVGRRAGDGALLQRLVPNFRPREVGQTRMPADRGRTSELSQQHSQALTDLAPPSMLVDEMHRVLHLSEKAGQYLSLPAGAPNYDATELVRPELRPELGMALHRAFEQGKSTLSLPIPVQFDGESRNICIQISRVNNADTQPKALVLFIEGGPAEIAIDREGTGEAGANADVRQLQEELAATRGHLKLTRQQYETAVENLRAANEELQSINEEYRSTAEELETSREELQSMNEELQTLNSELRAKLDVASKANNDLENLMAATDFATLFLDSDLRITRFTPSVRELFNISARDEGRKITDFSHQLEYSDFEDDVRAVVLKHEHIQREIHLANKQTLLVRLGPYRTAEGKSAGVVATFLNPEALKALRK